MAHSYVLTKQRHSTPVLTLEESPGVLIWRHIVLHINFPQ